MFTAVGSQDYINDHCPMYRYDLFTVFCDFSLQIVYTEGANLPLSYVNYWVGLYIIIVNLCQRIINKNAVSTCCRLNLPHVYRVHLNVQLHQGDRTRISCLAWGNVQFTKLTLDWLTRIKTYLASNKTVYQTNGFSVQTQNLSVCR